jgi:hypothetical protein
VKDTRFIEEANWILSNERGRARGEALLRELGEPALLAVGVRALLDESEMETAELPAVLHEDVTRFIGGHEVHSDATWFAIAKGLALDAPGAPTPANLVQRVSRLERAPQWVHQAFHEEAFALLERLDGQTREAWLALAAAPPLLATPRQDPASDAISVARREPMWQVLDPFELWDDSGAAIPLVAAHEPLNLLRRTDAQRWFRAVDAWDDGRLVFAALFGSHVRHDSEALLQYLTAAALVFDESLKWTGRTAALVLAQAIIEHASALANAVRGTLNMGGAEEDDANAQLTNDELPTYFRRAWRTLLARTDGLALAVALQVRLADARSVRGVYHVDVQGIALRSLSECLAEAGPSLATLRAMWRLRRGAHDGAGRSLCVSALRAFACAMTVAKSDELFDAELRDWLGELLAGDAWEWRTFAAGGSLPAFLENVAGVLAKNHDALSKLEALYSSFEPSRRRGEFGRTHGENNSDIASLVLIVLLVRVLARGNGAGNSDEAVMASARIFRRALRLFLVSSPGFDPTLSVRAVLTLVIEARVRASPAALAECLAPVLVNPCHAAEVAAVLLPIARRDELAETIATTYGSLLQLQDRAREWALATNLPGDSTAADVLATAMAARTGQNLGERIE